MVWKIQNVQSIFFLYWWKSFFFNFFHLIESQDDFNHHLFGDKVFPFLFQLMTLFKVDSQDHTILKIFDNMKCKHRRYVIENAFENLKCIFREFKEKIELDVSWRHLRWKMGMVCSWRDIWWNIVGTQVEWNTIWWCLNHIDC